MLVLVTVMSCPCYLNNFPLELTRCCEANFGFETLTKPQGEGSAAWAVALQYHVMYGIENDQFPKSRNNFLKSHARRWSAFAKRLSGSMRLL